MTILIVIASTTFLLSHTLQTSATSVGIYIRRDHTLHHLFKGAKKCTPDTKRRFLSNVKMQQTVSSLVSLHIEVLNAGLLF